MRRGAAGGTFLTFLYEFEEDLDEGAVLGGLQRVVRPVGRGPAARHEAAESDNTLTKRFGPLPPQEKNQKP